MPQMSTTIGTDNLGPAHTKSTIGMSLNGAWYSVEKGGPSTSRLEFMVGLVEGCVASGA
jgi:hypothetical protein